MTLTPDPAHAVSEKPYALVADPQRDPGSCAVYRLLYQFPTGCLGLRHDRDPKDEPVPIPPETIITRSDTVGRIEALKALLDKAWDDSGEALRGYKVEVDKIVAEHGRKVDVTSSEALKAFGIRAVVDVEAATNALLEDARKRRAAIWAFAVSQLATKPILPDLDSLA